MAYNSGNLDQMYQQAIMLHQAGQYKEAEQIYRKVINGMPNGPQAVGVINNLGAALLGQSRMKDAIKELQRALRYQSDNPDTLAALSTAYARMGKEQQSLEYARKVVNYYPNSGVAGLSLASLQINFGREDEAITTLNQTILNSPDYVEAYLTLGNIYSQSSRYPEAMAVYQSALENGHGTTALIHKSIGMIHHIGGDLKPAEESYLKAIELDPKDREMEVLMGNLLRDRGQFNEAATYYERVLEHDPQNTVALENLRRFRQQKISGWHFDMLADIARNDAYDKALNNSLNGGEKALDIGTGSGLLALMAARAGAEKVTACEMVPVLAEAATKIVADNGYQNKIKVINKKSTSLKVGEDMDEKVDLIVSEILDVGLLGEGVVPSVRHALENLANPGAKVIPQSADLYGVLIESEVLGSINPVGKISGFDLSHFDTFRISNEYQRYFLDQQPHRKLSDVFPIQGIDFRDLPPTTMEQSPTESPMEVQVTQDGQVHGVAFWFTLHLDDEISLSSGPEGEMVHWGQAFYFFREPVMVKAGETFKFKALYSDMLLRFAL